MPAMPELILASTSRYRQELLARLRLPFRCEAPDVDETALPGESPAALAELHCLRFEAAMKLRTAASPMPGSANCWTMPRSYIASAEYTSFPMIIRSAAAWPRQPQAARVSVAA